MFTFVGPKGERMRQLILERALRLFDRRGYERTTLKDIADASDVAVGLTYRYFCRKEELVLALYERLSEQVADRLKLPQGSVGARWAALERARFRVLAPHRRTLLALVQAALDPEGPLGVLSPATASVRARWLALHRQVVEGAQPAVAADAAVDVLYGLDLLLVLLWTQDRSQGARATREAIAQLAGLVDAVSPLLAIPAAAEAVGALKKVLGSTSPKKERS
jgi:AcrR family transcriptional regulator